MANAKESVAFQPPQEQRFNIKVIGATIAAVVVVSFAIGFASTCVSKIAAGQVGVIVNNLAGTVSSRDRAGVVLHLPFGLTDVYLLDKTVQTFELGAKDYQVKIKSEDGSDVFIDATVTFTIDPNRAHLVLQQVGGNERGGLSAHGVMDSVHELLLAYARSILRDELGRLKIEEVIQADTRNAAVRQFQIRLQEKVDKFGVVINTISAQNPSFNPEYEKLIGSRKQADQDFTNQKSAQERAVKDQERQIAEAERSKEVAVLEEKGRQARRVIEAAGEVSQAVKRAEGEVSRVSAEGDRELAKAIAEAEAIREETLKKAEGIRALAAAYRVGGMGLVREALAAKYAGRQINGRPYSLSSHVDRLRMEEEGGSYDGEGASTKEKEAAASRRAK